VPFDGAAVGTVWNGVPPRCACEGGIALLTYNHMVVGAERESETVDLIFHALADRTRRDIIRRTVDGGLSVSAIARCYPISVTAIQKHVAVLERAGLVVRTRQGREQLVQSHPETISRARGLLAEFEGLWRDRLDRIDDLVKEPDAGDRRWP